METNVPQVPQNNDESTFKTVTPPMHEAPQQTIIIQHGEKKANGVGTAGFVLALIGFIFCWVPVVNIILWILGVILSAVGVAKKPKGLAIAGLCISFINLIISIIFFGIFAAALAAS